MADPVAETAGEHAGAVVEAAVDSAVAQVENAVEAAEARAEAAEDALEAVTDSARRDILHDEITDVEEELEEWRAHTQSEIEGLRSTVTLLQAELQSLRDQMTELSNRSTVTTVSTPAPSEPIPGAQPPEPIVTVTTVEPGSAAPAPMPAAPEPSANQRRWI